MRVYARARVSMHACVCVCLCVCVCVCLCVCVRRSRRTIMELQRYARTQVTLTELTLPSLVLAPGAMLPAAEYVFRLTAEDSLGIGRRDTHTHTHTHTHTWWHGARSHTCAPYECHRSKLADVYAARVALAVRK